jgi:hypothetical protein
VIGIGTNIACFWIRKMKDNAKHALPGKKSIEAPRRTEKKFKYKRVIWLARRLALCRMGTMVEFYMSI